MKKLTAAVLIAAGAAGMLGGAHHYATNYSPERIFVRQRALIERNLRPTSKAVQSSGIDLKRMKFNQLRAGLTELKQEPAEKLCRYERLFESRLESGSDAEAVDTINSQSFTPFESCSTSSRVKESALQWYSLAGMASFLIGAIGLIGSMLRRREDAPTLAPDLQKRRKEIQKERADALSGYGFSQDQAETILSESMAHQSVYDVTSCAHTAKGTFRLLERYGFAKAEVMEIVEAYPGVLNMAPEAINDRLMTLEKGGEVQPASVRSTVLRLPATLGR